MVDQVGYLPLRGDRWTPLVKTLSFYGVDFTSAVFAAQVRITPDATGVPLIDLVTVTSASAEGVRLIYAGSATIADHIAAGRIEATEVPDGFENTDVVALSQVSIRINETTMEGLPFPYERGDDWIGAWDMHITMGGLKEKWLEGEFVNRAGVTQ